MDINLHLEQVLKDNRYLDNVPVFRDAVVSYLVEQGSLAQVQQIWEAEQKRLPSLDSFLCELWKRPRVHLDAFDYRALDLYLATDSMDKALIAIADDESSSEQVDEVYAYLASQDIASDYILRELVGALEAFFDHGLGPQEFSALTQQLLHCLPADPNLFVQFLKLNTDPFWDQRPLLSGSSHQSTLIQLLLALPSPPLDLIWAVVQVMEAHQDSSLGWCAAKLLELDPARFTLWARQIASPASTASSSCRHTVLKALLKLDPVWHLDLAMAAASELLSDDYWHHFLQMSGLEAAYQLDPALYRSLVEKMAQQEQHWLGLWASNLLAGVRIEDLGSFWWRCIAEESVPVALTAFESLQAAGSWRGLIEKQENAHKLLTHPTQEIRDVARTWLVEHQGALQTEWVRSVLRDAARSWLADYQSASQTEWPEWVRSALNEDAS